MSPLPFPDLQLAQDLALANSREADALRDRHLNGEFDASVEESEAWFNSEEGQNTIKSLTR